MSNTNQSVMIIVSCPMISQLRNMIIRDFFSDSPIDKFIDKRISLIMEEFINDYYQFANEYDDIYRVVIHDILDFLSHYVNTIGIKSIEYWYHDSIIIHCSPLGVKNAAGSHVR